MKSLAEAIMLIFIITLMIAVFTHRSFVEVYTKPYFEDEK